MRDPTQWLQFHAHQRPEQLFLETSDGRRLSYADMQALVERLVDALLALEVDAGDRVVAQVEKSPEAVALYLACLSVGAAFVPLNTAYTLAELEYFLGDAAPSLAVVRPAQRDLVIAIAQSNASTPRPPPRCRVTMAGNSFMVTVSAPKAPCRQTHTRVAVGHQGLTGISARPRLRAHQLPAVSVRINTPTAVAR